MNERLVMIAEKLGEANLKETIESNLVKLQHVEVSLLNKLEEDIDPDGIYNLSSGNISFKRRAKTYLITNDIGEKFVIKIAELEEGEVSRLGLWVELGKVRIARMEKKLHKFRSRISRNQIRLSELHLNEILYDVPCSDKAIKWHQAMFGEPEIEVLPQLEFQSHDWNADGF